MKLTGARIERFLSAPTDDIIGVLLFGPDRGFVKERAQKLLLQWGGHMDDAFSSTVLTADDLTADPARLPDEMAALSLLGDHRLVRLRMDHERPGQAVAKLVATLDHTPEKAAARLVVEGGDMSPRSHIRKAFEAAKHFVAIGCYADNTASLANLVRAELTANGMNIHPDALELWVPMLEGDRALSRNEIEKMILFKGAGAEAGAVVSTDDVKTLASGAQNASIDDIIFLALSGMTAKCDAAFTRALASKINTAVILRALQRHLGRLLEANAHMQSGERAESAMKSLRPPVFRMQERIFTQHLKMWPTVALSRSLSESLKAEEQIKTAGAPSEAIVGRLLLALASFAEKRR